MHAKSARILAARGAAAERIASHLLAAEPSGERWSLDVLRTAAAGALARGAPEGAVPYLAREFMLDKDVAEKYFAYWVQQMEAGNDPT